VTLVTMINSVGEHPAGEEVELPDEQADTYILRGYADGPLSREYSAEEQSEIRANQQVVGV
jgi:hypothetical protein